jgi:hypothetical protein
MGLVANLLPQFLAIRFSMSQLDTTCMNRWQLLVLPLLDLIVPATWKAENNDVGHHDLAE